MKIQVQKAGIPPRFNPISLQIEMTIETLEELISLKTALDEGDLYYDAESEKITDKLMKALQKEI